MGYVRPSQVSGSEFTLAMPQASFPGTNVPTYGPFSVLPFNAGLKFVYVAVYDNRAPGSSPWAVSHSPIIYIDRLGHEQASSIIALTTPDGSAVVGPFGVTSDPAEYAAALLSGNRQLFLDADAVGNSWPAGASIRFAGRSQFAPDSSRSLTSTQEVFVWTPSPSDPGGGGGGGGDGGLLECGPVPRPPWPYPGSMDVQFRSDGSRPVRRRLSGNRMGPIDLTQ